MSDLISLYERAKSSPNNFSFSELCLLVEKAGFEFKRRKRGSHRIYKHPMIRGVDGLANIQNVHGKAKPYQVRQIVGLIEQHGLIIERGE